MLEKDLITCQQAAAILGRSPSTISRALTQGRLSYGDAKRKLIYRPGLEQRFANSTRRKADAPQVTVREERVALSPEPEPIAKDYWERLAESSTSCWKVPLLIGQRHQIHNVSDCLSGRWMSSGPRLSLRG